MANEIRLRSNNISGAINDNPLTAAALTINSPAFTDLPVVNTTNHLMITLDPLEIRGAAEIVKVTAHGAAATSITVLRGQEGTTAREHALGVTWSHGPVASDWTEIVTSSARPASPYEGQQIYETDTDLSRKWNGTSWQVLDQVRVPNANGPIVGSAATLTSAVFMQMGTNVVSTSLGGDFTIPFQQAFPNGLLLFMVQQGDNTHPGASFIPFNGGAALNQQVVRMYLPSGAVWASSGNLRVTWLAIGW